MNAGICKDTSLDVVEQLIPDHIFNEIEGLEKENITMCEVESIDSLLANAPKIGGIDAASLDSLMAEIEKSDLFKYSEDELLAVLFEVEAGNLFDILDAGIEEPGKHLSESAGTTVDSCSQQKEMNINIQQTLAGQVKQLQSQQTLQQQQHMNSDLQGELNHFEIQRNFLHEMELLKQLPEALISKGMELDSERNSVPLSHCDPSNGEGPLQSQPFSNEKIHEEQQVNSQVQESLKRVKAIPINYPQLLDIVREVEQENLQVEKASTTNEGVSIGSQYPTISIVVINNSVSFSDSGVCDKNGPTQNKRLFNESNQQEADTGDQRSIISQSKRVCMVPPVVQWQSEVVNTTNSRPPSPCLGNNSPQSIQESQVRLTPLSNNEENGNTDNCDDAEDNINAIYSEGNKNLDTEGGRKVNLNQENNDENETIDDCHDEEHNNTVTDDGDEGDKIAAEGSCNKKPESFNICSNDVSTERSLKKNIELREVKRYVCGVKNYNSSFTTKGSLASHKRVCKGVKMYICDECNRSFKQKSDLIPHLRIHTGEKPFSCNVCNRKCTRKDILTAHSRLHTGEKPYSCKICNKRFRQRYALSYHLKIHTGEMPYRCNDCNKSFRQKSHLTRHLKVHAGTKPHMLRMKSIRVKHNLTEHSKSHTGKNKI